MSTVKEDKAKVSEKKRIAIVANTTWNIYNFRLNILRKLSQEGYQLYVIAPVDSFMHYKDDFPGLVHIPLQKLGRKSTNPLKDIRLTFELIRIYKKIKPDLILHYTVKPNIFGGIAAGMTNIASMAVVTGLGYAFIHQGFLKKITVLLYRFSSRFHKRFIFENIDDLLLFQKLRMIKKDQGISIKGCGVNSDHFSPRASDNGSTITFSFIGRLLYDKGIREYVNAAKTIISKYDKVRFWIVGNFDFDNPAAVSRDDLSAFLVKDKIEYKGFQQDVRELIAATDCVVLPSYREAIARALTEAMSMEKPVIATQTPGCREAVDENYNGFLVPIKDSDALSKAIERFLLLSEKERILMGENGRKKVLKEFDDKLIAEQISSLIRSCMAEQN